MNGYLIAEEGPYKGRIIEISSERSLVLGRDPDESDVTLDDPEVSRKHALFFSMMIDSMLKTTPKSIPS